MLAESKFNGDISNWNLSELTHDKNQILFNIQDNDDY